MGAIVTEVVIKAPEMEPEMVAQMDAAYREFYAAMRADFGVVIDLTKAARRAWEREQARPGGRRRVVVQRVPRLEAVPSKVRRSSAKGARRASLAARTWSHRRTDEQRARATALRAASRARLTDDAREANNRRQTELRHAAEAALSAEALQARREARREADRARIAALSPEAREARREAERARSAARHAALSPEQVAARKARQAADYQRRKGRTA